MEIEGQKLRGIIKNEISGSGVLRGHRGVAFTQTESVSSRPTGNGSFHYARAKSRGYQADEK